MGAGAGRLPIFRSSARGGQRQEKRRGADRPGSPLRLRLGAQQQCLLAGPPSEARGRQAQQQNLPPPRRTTTTTTAAVLGAAQPSNRTSPLYPV